MKKFLVFVLAVVVTFAMAVSAFAVPAGKTVEFTPKGADKVVFDGKYMLTKVSSAQLAIRRSSR
jgi:hypothetical protein